ncbi:MAG: nucleoside deaminase [Erysipelotrichaceae bacterium]|jgi:tRNA(adenine34) deaminase|nr:nucleoside deaminase [Erysipelotrichaceae bacterium]MBR4122414.1 nucleoside deaminase [Erysipelotrichaceae bacterium]
MDFMAEALKEARKALKYDEVPIGCVIVKDGAVLSRAFNRKVTRQDATCHAEIEAIRKAEKKLGNWHLDECDLYVTLEPCLMCTGAIIQSRVRKVVFATRDPKGGAFYSNLRIEEVRGLNHYPKIEEGDHQEEASALLKEFFRKKRNKA